MSHLLKYTEWKGAGEDWYCNDVSDLGGISGVWWLPARMMKISPAEYMKWVIENFHPDTVYHSKDCSFVGWCWKSQNDMRKFKNKINALARQENFMI